MRGQVAEQAAQLHLEAEQDVVGGVEDGLVLAQHGLHVADGLVPGHPLAGCGLGPGQGAGHLVPSV